MAIARGARARGAVLEQNCAVTALQPRADGGWDVVTERGTVRANRVINCAGGILSYFPPIINYLNFIQWLKHNSKRC